MKLSEFILLNEEEKKVFVLNKGVLIGKRVQGDCMVFLFQMDHFYVEFYCNLENRQVEEFRMFTGIELLDPYLDSKQIDDLLNQI